MAKANTPAVVETAGTEEVVPTYFNIKLKSVVSMHGRFYRPSDENIIVDEVTLKAMGDAVADAKQV